MQLFFLSYFGGSTRSYDAVMSRLGDLECAAISVNGLATHGYSVANASGDLAKRIAEIARDEYVLVGHSMGGKLALSLAGAAPVSLRGVILLAPSPPTPEPMSDADRAFMLENRGSRESALAILGGAAHRKLDENTLETAIEAHLEWGETDWQNWLQIGSREDVSANLASVRVPVLVWTGEFDANMTSEILGREIVEKVPGARLEIVGNAGHLLPQEAPDEVAAKIRAFVEEL